MLAAGGVVSETAFELPHTLPRKSDGRSGLRQGQRALPCEAESRRQGGQLTTAESGAQQQLVQLVRDRSRDLGGVRCNPDRFES